MEGKPGSSATAPENAPRSADALAQEPAIETRNPSILLVTLHEGRGLSLPEDCRDSVTSLQQAASQDGGANHRRVSGKCMPYALLDLDKVQVLMHSVGGTPENPSWAGIDSRCKFDVSRVTPLTIHLYIRNPKAQPGSGRSQDMLIGSARIDLEFDSPYKDAKLIDMQHGTGSLRLGLEFSQSTPANLTIDNFDLLEVVGRGILGMAMQVRKKDTNCLYALQSIRKATIPRSEVAHALAQRSVLAQIDNPFIVPLAFSFQSPEKLYLLLPFMSGGELFQHLNKQGCFDVARSRLYTAELLCAFESLHSFNVIFRHLKYENIFLDHQGHIAISDFGLCKLQMEDEDDASWGIPEYIAPEVLLGQGYNETVDWWTLGMLLHDMLTDSAPFYDEATEEMRRKILSEPLVFPDVVPPVVRDLLEKLLTRNPADRLGANGVAEIKDHPFFDQIDWEKLRRREYEPAFKPNVVEARDNNYDHVLMLGPLGDSYVEGPVLSEEMQKQFNNFSYSSSKPK